MGWAGPMTHRQYAVWAAWLWLEWNRPSRTDHYLMRVAQRAHQGWVKEPAKVTEEDQRMRFVPAGSQGDVRGGLTREEATRLAKQRWGMMLGRDLNGRG